MSKDFPTFDLSNNQFTFKTTIMNITEKTQLTYKNVKGEIEKSIEFDSAAQLIDFVETSLISGQMVCLFKGKPKVFNKKNIAHYKWFDLLFDNKQYQFKDAKDFEVVASLSAKDYLLSKSSFWFNPKEIQLLIKRLFGRWIEIESIESFFKPLGIDTFGFEDGIEGDVSFQTFLNCGFLECYLDGGLWTAESFFHLVFGTIGNKTADILEFEKMLGEAQSCLKIDSKDIYENQLNLFAQTDNR